MAKSTTELSHLHTLIDEDRAELDLGQPRITGTDAGAADHVGHVEQLPLGLLPQHPEPFLVAGTQLAGLLLQLLQLLHLSGPETSRNLSKGLRAAV